MDIELASIQHSSIESHNPGRSDIISKVSDRQTIVTTNISKLRYFVDYLRSRSN